MSATLEASTPTSAGSAGQRTVVTRVKDWATQSPDAVAMREKRYGLWQDITWATYWDMVQTTAHALMSLGIGPGDRVAIHSENRPEWLYADLGTVACRAITMGLYPTNPAAEVEYLLKDSGSRVLVAEDQEQVDKALAVGDSLDELEWIVYIEPRGVRDYDDRRLISWDDFLERGREHRAAHEGVLEQLAAEVSPDDVMTLIYTSGTTGPPKGAMLTVGNVEFAISKLVSEGGFYDPPPNPDDVAVSYLPLCHVAERTATTWVGRRVRRPDPLRRVHRDGAGQPQGGPAHAVLRGAAHLGEDPRRHPDPHVLGLAAEEVELRALDEGRRAHRRRAGGRATASTRGGPRPCTGSATRSCSARCGTASGCASAGPPGPAPPRSRRRS